MSSYKCIDGGCRQCRGKGVYCNGVMCLELRQQEKYRLLGLNIAYYRKKQGLSQMQLAERINISRTHMSRIETADCAVSLDVIFEICDTLNVAPDRLFDFRQD